MPLHHIELEKITEDDLRSLIDDRVCESSTIDYKKTWDCVTDVKKRELLCDVSAMANTNGGDIVYGMQEGDDELKGFPVELVGLNNFHSDPEISKIENLLRDSVHPRIIGIKMRAFTLKNNNWILLIRAPMSFNSPHMVRHAGITRFCGRNSNGKYDLDVNEIRSAFLGNETCYERIRNFRLDRINKLLSGASMVKLKSDNLVIMHLLPVMGLSKEIRLDVEDFNRPMDINLLMPLGSVGFDRSYNFNGLLTCDEPLEKVHESYLQIWRNGFIESVNSEFLVGNTEKTLPVYSIEPEVVVALRRFVVLLRALGISVPYVLCLSLLNVRGFSIPNDQGYQKLTPTIDCDNLLCDETLIEGEGKSAEAILRPAFNQIWNACGYERDQYFDNDGQFKRDTLRIAGQIPGDMWKV